MIIFFEGGGEGGLNKCVCNLLAKLIIVIKAKILTNQGIHREHKMEHNMEFKNSSKFFQN
jgi:hypothetical protein